ncbi:hypothetical protein Tco_1474453 [Tanacetum coccineum]
MGTKVTSSSGSVLEEPEIQKLQMQAKIFKENSLNKLNALKSTTQLLERQSILYQQAFAQLFGDSVRTFKFQLSQHMNNLETLLNAETLHEMDSKSALSVIKVQFERFINSDLLKPLDIYSRSFSSDREVRENFRDYTKMTAQTFKETIIQNMNSIEQCIIERASHEQELKMTLKRLNESQVQIQECTVQKVQSSVTSSGDETSSGIVSEEEIDKKELEAHYGFMAKIQEVLPAESSSTDTPLEQVQNNDENNVFANERQHSEKNSAECTDERAALANLIANLTLDTEENKTILKQLKKANASLTQELKECKTNLDETGRALGEAISCQDSCLIALQNKQNEFEKYKAFNDRTIDYDILQTKLNETLGLLARKDIDIKEGLKTKAYEILVVNQKHDELVKKSLLTKSKFEGQLKEKSKVISDLKVKERRDIDKMIEMDKQIKIPYDNSDPANRFCPNGEKTVTLEKESRSKLNKDTVKPYDYTQNKFSYEIFKHILKTILIRLERAKKLEDNVGKTFVRTNPNIAKNVAFLPNLPQNRKQAEIHSNVLKLGMHRIATSTKQNREPQLPHASRNTNPHVSKSTGVTHPTSVSRPQLKSYQVKDKVVPNISQVKFTKKEVEDHHRISSISKKPKSVTVCNNTTNSRTSNVNVVCAECGKCMFNLNHDACVSRYLNVMNARTKKPNVVPIGDSKPKRKANKSVATTHKKTVASYTTIQKPKSYFKELPRSSMFKRRLIAADQASVFMAMMSVHISSGLVLHQMTSDHNRSELGIQDHNNEQSSSKAGSKVVP